MKRERERGARNPYLFQQNLLCTTNLPLFYAYILVYLTKVRDLIFTKITHWYVCLILYKCTINFDNSISQQKRKEETMTTLVKLCILVSHQKKKEGGMYSLKKIVNLCRIDTSRYFRAFILLNITYFMIYIYIYIYICVCIYIYIEVFDLNWVFLLFYFS